MLKIITETVKSNKKKVRISRYKEFDNGHVFFDFQTMTIPDAENLAKEMSIKDPNDIYYVKIDDIMNPDTDIRWINGKSYKSSQVKLAGDKPKILIEKQHYRMVVKKESGLNADGFTISIYQGHNKVDGEIYRYGYNASYDRIFAKPFKPYVDDIIQDWKEKYNISDDMVDYVQGKNVFKDNRVSESDIKSKNGLKENSHKPTGNHLPQRVKDKANRICSRYSNLSDMEPYLTEANKMTKEEMEEVGIQEVELGSLDKGTYFTLNPISEPRESQVYVKDIYDRSSKKYWCYKFSDINDGREFPKNKKVYINFTF